MAETSEADSPLSGGNVGKGLPPRARQSASARRRSSQSRPSLALTAVCLFFGLALVVQLRTESRLHQAPPVESSADLEAIAADLYDSNTSLRQEVDKLLAQRNGAGAAEAAKRAEAQAEITRLQEFNGVVPISGPGVEIRISALPRRSDLEDLLNELRNAGAEAIAISGQRVVFNTAISGSDNQPSINGVPLAGPTTIDAIGKSDVLDRALARKGGMLAYLKTAYPQATIEMSEQTNLNLPAYRGTLPISAGQ